MELFNRQESHDVNDDTMTSSPQLVNSSVLDTCHRKDEADIKWSDLGQSTDIHTAVDVYTQENTGIDSNVEPMDDDQCTSLLLPNYVGGIDQSGSPPIQESTVVTTYNQTTATDIVL